MKSWNWLRKSLLLAVLATAATSPATAQEERCRADTLKQWYCPTDRSGTAVVDALGAVVCAPGRCVELEGEWHCSTLSGGAAELTPAGPVCEGECRAPRASECKKI